MTTPERTRRAPAMDPERRRAAIVDATLAVIAETGEMPSTRAIASAANIAEGTIYRVFDNKDDLRDAVMVRAFDPAPLLHQLAGVDTSQPLRESLVEVVGLQQRRLASSFVVMRALGLMGPPRGAKGAPADEVRTKTNDLLIALVHRHASDLTVTPEELVHALRLFAFSAIHPAMAHGAQLSPDRVVDLLLYGALVRPAATTEGD